MFYHKQGDRYTENFKWLIRLDLSFIESEKTECLSTVIEDGRCGKYRRDLLNPVKFAKSDEMVIMPVSPDHGIDIRGTAQEKLLPEIR
jgi:hypothetical protein